MSYRNRPKEKDMNETVEILKQEGEFLQQNWMMTSIHAASARS